MPGKIKLALFMTIFLWASAFVGIRLGLHAYSPGSLALFRYLIASVCMGIIYFSRDRSRRSSMRLLDIGALLGIGAIGIGIYNLTLNDGELYISSGMASFIISQSPIITALIAILFLKEPINLLSVFGFILSVLGVMLIAWGEKGGFKWDESIVYMVIATFASGFYSVLQKPFLNKYHVIEVMTYIIWGGTLFLSVYLFQMKHDVFYAPITTTLTVVYLGIFPAALGYLGWSYVLAAIPVSRAVSFFYFMPFLATVLGWICLGEVPAELSIFGGLLAILGVWIVNQSYKRRITHTASALVSSESS